MSPVTKNRAIVHIIWTYSAKHVWIFAVTGDLWLPEFFLLHSMFMCCVARKKKKTSAFACHVLLARNPTLLILPSQMYSPDSLSTVKFNKACPGVPAPGLDGAAIKWIMITLSDTQRVANKNTTVSPQKMLQQGHGYCFDSTWVHNNISFFFTLLPLLVFFFCCKIFVLFSRTWTRQLK